MVAAEGPQTTGEQETEAAVTSGERPLPFVLRVAAHWEPLADVPDAPDGPILVRRRATLTGRLALTSEGGDVQFSDLGV